MIKCEKEKIHDMQELTLILLQIGILLTDRPWCSPVQHNFTEHVNVKPTLSPKTIPLRTQANHEHYFNYKMSDVPYLDWNDWLLLLYQLQLWPLVILPSSKIRLSKIESQNCSHFLRESNPKQSQSFLKFPQINLTIPNPTSFLISFYWDPLWLLMSL